MPRSFRAVGMGAVLAAWMAVGGSAQEVRLRVSATIYMDALGGGMLAPQGVAFDGDSKLVVADTGNRRLLIYEIRDDDLIPGPEIRVVQLPVPTKVRFDTQGDILVLDGRSHRVVRLGSDGSFKSRLDVRSDEGPVEPVITSFDIDQGGNLYLLDPAGGRVWVVDASGKVAREIAFAPEVGFLSDLTVTSSGVVFAVDSVGRRVFVARRNETAFSALTDAMPEDMAFPTGITSDSLGHLFLADQGGSGIVILGQNGDFEGRQAGMGWREGFLRYPADILATDDYVFVADRANNRVQRFTIVP